MRRGEVTRWNDGGVVFPALCLTTPKCNGGCTLTPESTCRNTHIHMGWICAPSLSFIYQLHQRLCLFSLVLSFLPQFILLILLNTHTWCSVVWGYTWLLFALRPGSDYWAHFRTPKISSCQCGSNHLTSPSSYIDAWLKSTSLAL